MQDMMTMIAPIVAMYPSFKGPLDPAESVKHQREVIAKASIEQSGQFISHWGNKEWL